MLPAGGTQCSPDRKAGGLHLSSLICLLLALTVGGAAGFIACAMFSVGQQSDFR
jgi:hypothetical protein